MRFLVALASMVLGLALVAGFIYRDKPADESFAASGAAETVASTNQVTDGDNATGGVDASLVKTIPAPEPFVPKIVAPKAVAEIAAEQPTILNADRSRFEPVVTAPAPQRVTQGEGQRGKRILVMAIQGELSRVGCYTGTVDGNWAASSKSAMYWFLNRVNAKLPVNNPDQAHLNLLKTAERDFCKEKKVTPAFVTKVTPAQTQQAELNNPAASLPNSAYSDARRRAGFEPVDGDAGSMAQQQLSASAELPEPMAVGRIEPKQPKPRRYRRTSDHVENLFKHPLGRF